MKRTGESYPFSQQVIVNYSATSNQEFPSLVLKFPKTLNFHPHLHRYQLQIEKPFLELH